MQTIYYKTSNFIQHNGNLVDLNEFRCRQALAQEDSLARQPEKREWYEQDWCEQDWCEQEPGFRPVVLELTPKERCRARQERWAWRLDICASLAMVCMTVLFALRVML